MDGTNQIEVEIRVLDDDGNEEHMLKKYNLTATENGVDAYFMYEQLILFMKMCGYADTTIAHIQWIEEEE